MKGVQVGAEAEAGAGAGAGVEAEAEVCDAAGGMKKINIFCYFIILLFY